MSAYVLAVIQCTVSVFIICRYGVSVRVKHLCIVVTLADSIIDLFKALVPFAGVSLKMKGIDFRTSNKQGEMSMYNCMLQSMSCLGTDLFQVVRTGCEIIP